MIRFIDWWRTGRPGFPGSAALHDAAEANCPAAGARAIAHMLVIQAAAELVGDRRATLVDGATAASYVVKLVPVDHPESSALFGCLAALQRRDVSALATALHAAAAVCMAQAAMASARSMAQLSYNAALEVGSWEDALHAARLMSRLAVLDENPVAAERWEARAELQSRRLMPA